MPEEEIAEARTRLESVIAEGVSALNAGRIDEALAIAESAVTTDPVSVAAFSLKTSCHERRGEIAEALECAERIVELNPDSELDKIKRNQLRSALMSAANQSAPLDKRTALIGAISTVVLVCCVGAFFIIQNNRNAERQRSELLAAQTQSAQTTPIVSTDPNQNQNNEQNNPQTPTTNQPSTANPQSNPNTANPATNQDSTPAINTDRSDGRLPQVSQTPGPPVTIEPMRIQTDPRSSQQAPSNPTRDTAPKNTETKRDDNEPVDETPTANPGPRENPGTIEITVHNGTNAKPLPGGSDNIDGGGVNALINTGRQRFMVGNYAGAIDNFERALRAGGDPVQLNQRLGQAYERMGRTSEAVSAYGRAVDACQAAISSGRGNRAALEAKLEACRAAMKVLQGG